MRCFAELATTELDELTDELLETAEREQLATRAAASGRRSLRLQRPPKLNHHYLSLRPA